MNKKLKEKLEKLIKQKKIISILTPILWLISIFIEIDVVTRFIPWTEFFLLILNIDKILVDTIISILEFIFRFLPLSVYLSCKGLEFKKHLEIKEIKNNPNLYIEEEKKEPQIIDEQEIIEVYDILSKFENLPRNKQMKLLNYIKGDLTNQNIELCQEIDRLNEKYKEILQTECEDILFPDFDEQNNDYTKKRKK